MRAMSWPRLTAVLKSAWSSLTCPDTWEPTWTVTTAFRLPLVGTAAVRGPRVTGAVRGRGPVVPFWA